MRVKGFTILEILINIVITSIIIGLVYFIYSSMIQRIVIYGKTIEEQNNLEVFFLLLKTDFYKAEKIIEEDNGFSVQFYSDSQVIYMVNNQYLYRVQNSNKDSIALQNIELTSIKDPLRKEEMIIQVDITTLLYGSPTAYSAIKTYPNIFQLELYEH